MARISDAELYRAMKICGNPRKRAVRIDFYFMEGGPPDGEETYADRHR
jgi:hypothetical protein